LRLRARAEGRQRTASTPALGYVDGTIEKDFYVKPLNGFLPGPRIE
jgi:hypothetical protein